jgi:hypothetical protein
MKLIWLTPITGLPLFWLATGSSVSSPVAEVLIDGYG